MRILADENTDAEWIRALVGDGHDVLRVTDCSSLETGDPDRDVLAVAKSDTRVVLTADQSDFAAPPLENHAGVVIVADVTRTGGEIRQGIRHIERVVPDVSSAVLYLGDWI